MFLRVYDACYASSNLLLGMNYPFFLFCFFCSYQDESYTLSTAQLLFWLTGACYYDSNQSMYVFGGCTQSSCNAAFNDLWRLDLNSKEWIRPLASGTILHYCQ